MATVKSRHQAKSVREGNFHCDFLWSSLLQSERIVKFNFLSFPLFAFAAKLGRRRGASDGKQTNK